MLSELIQDMTLSVSELNEYANRLLMNNELLSGLLVAGEVSNFRRYPSGHWYFSLKDEQSAVRCVMFKQCNQSVSFDVSDGMHITVGGYASIYLRDGSFQVYVQTMHSDGAGSLFERYEELKKQLAQQGLFDSAHKKRIPRYPKRIGVVTSSAGAAIHDIIEVASRRNPKVDILLVPVSVQGKTAAGEIAAAIHTLNLREDIDLIIIGRGGGSIEDLWAFNEAVVAHAVYQSIIPVISAVGHETDTTISDYVADLRAPTPSAAAEMAVPLFDAWLQLLDTAIMRMETAVIQRLEQNRKHCDALVNVFGPSRILQTVSHQDLCIEQKKQCITAALTATLKNADRRISVAKAKLEAYSVQSVLKRGYAAVMDANSAKAITGIDEFHRGQDIVLILKDGTAQAAVTQVDKREENEHV